MTSALLGPSDNKVQTILLLRTGRIEIKARERPFWSGSLPQLRAQILVVNRVAVVIAASGRDCGKLNELLKVAKL